MNRPNVENVDGQITGGEIRAQERIVSSRTEDFGRILSRYRTYLRPVSDVLNNRITRPTVGQDVKKAGDILHEAVVAQVALEARQAALNRIPPLGSVSDNVRTAEYQRELGRATAVYWNFAEEQTERSLVFSNNRLRAVDGTYKSWLRNFPLRGVVGLGMIGLWATGNGVDGLATYPVLSDVHSILRDVPPALRIGGEFLALSGALDALRVHGEDYFRRHAQTLGVGIGELSGRIASCVEFRITHGNRYVNLNEQLLLGLKTSRLGEMAEVQALADKASVPAFLAPRDTGVAESNKAVKHALAEAKFTDALIDAAGRQRLLRLFTAVGLLAGMTIAEAPYVLDSLHPRSVHQVGRAIDSYPHSEARPEEPEHLDPGPTRSVTVLTGFDVTLEAVTGNAEISSLKGFVEAKIIADQIMDLRLGHEFDPHSVIDLAKYEAAYAKDQDYYKRAIELAKARMRDVNMGQNNIIGDWVVHDKIIYGLTAEEVQQIANQAVRSRD